jgi:hypothetical protein
LVPSELSTEGATARAAMLSRGKLLAMLSPPQGSHVTSVS